MFLRLRLFAPGQEGAHEFLVYGMEQAPAARRIKPGGRVEFDVIGGFQAQDIPDEVSERAAGQRLDPGGGKNHFLVLPRIVPGRIDVNAPVILGEILACPRFFGGKSLSKMRKASKNLLSSLC